MEHLSLYSNCTSTFIVYYCIHCGMLIRNVFKCYL
jgi:hypothetical protein